MGESLSTLLTVGMFMELANSQEPWTKGDLLFEGEFNDALLNQWVIELEKPDRSVVEIQDSQLNIDVGGGATIWFKHSKIYHKFDDPEPLKEGHFGFRTVRNHELIDHFRIYQLAEAWHPPD